MAYARMAYARIPYARKEHLMTKILARIELDVQHSTIELIVKDNHNPDWEERREVTLTQFAEAMHKAETANRPYLLNATGYNLAHELGMLKHT